MNKANKPLATLTSENLDDASGGNPAWGIAGWLAGSVGWEVVKDIAKNPHKLLPRGKDGKMHGDDGTGYPRGGAK